VEISSLLVSTLLEPPLATASTDVSHDILLLMSHYLSMSISVL